MPSPSGGNREQSGSWLTPPDPCIRYHDDPGCQDGGGRGRVLCVAFLSLAALREAGRGRGDEAPPAARTQSQSMIELSRDVRFCIPFSEGELSSTGEAGHNTFAGSPSMPGLGAYYELSVCCEGEVDPVTGYLINIAEIDQAVRSRAVPLIEQAVGNRSGEAPALLLLRIMTALQATLSRPVRSVTWRLTPFYNITMERAHVDRFLISQQFDFAAAHRLHCPQLSDEENRSLFGKCNNPHGHGHNYRLEVVVSQPIPPEGRPPGLPLPELERIVDERVIRRFDHMHLNLDTAEFAGLNPSVEHIAQVCHNLLAGPVSVAGAELRHVTVWETEKTRCTYPAPA
jgi:6-pyruvoyltetrahydropterin/6-carboxytetrahydropterin synthase